MNNAFFQCFLVNPRFHSTMGRETGKDCQKFPSQNHSPITFMAETSGGISAAGSRELENLLAKPGRGSWGFIPGLRGVRKLSRGRGPGHAPGGCRSKATTALYALPRIRSSARSPSIFAIINVIFGDRKTPRRTNALSWWRIVCVTIVSRDKIANCLRQ